MSEHQLGTAVIGSASSPGAFLVTVHGIGPYDPSTSASGRLVRTLDEGLRASMKPVDVDWYTVVKTKHFKDDVAQLSRATLEAAHLGTDEHRRITGRVIGALGLGYEALFKLAVLAIPVSALLLICVLPIYVRFGSMGIAGPATSFALRWTGLLWAATAAIFATGVTLSLLFRVAGLRLEAATLLRRMVLVPLQPVIPLGYRLSETETRTIARNIAFFAIGYGLFTEFTRWLSPDAAAQWSGLGLRNLSIGAAGFIAVVLVGHWISKVINTPLKLARDIFNYIGDAGQRTLIQDRLRSRVSDIPDGADVILVGHSLGSVIALDSLCNSDLWGRFQSVSFVTCGSPVYRFFQRFFPGLFFPRESTACCARIQSRSRAIRWLNVYRAGLRRGDPVGQALFARGGSGADLPVFQQERILMQAHVDYWNDGAVISVVEEAWGRMLPPAPAEPESLPVTPARHGSLFDRAAGAAATVIVLCALIGFFFGVVNAYLIVQQRRDQASAFLSQAATRGLEITARVTHSTTTWGYGADLTFPVQVYEFEFRDRDGTSRMLTFRENEGSGFDGGLYFRSEAFRTVLGREARSDDRRTFTVRIVRVEGDPLHLTLANPWLRAVPSDFPAFEVFWTGIGASFWMMVLLEFGVAYASLRIAAAILPPPKN